MDSILKSLGIYKALHASAVQFNSIVFRVVVGFLADVPVEIIALIPAIEFTLNFLLEVPAGYLADKYGRIPFAIIGHVTVILGLSCGYIALLELTNPDVTHALFVFHGVLIGFTRPLTSGSVEAFYQDALERIPQENGSKNVIDKSFTLSKKYGKHLTTIAVVMAFLAIYLFHETVGAHHAFVLGIGLWILTLIKLICDYKNFGDVQDQQSDTVSIFDAFRASHRALISVFYSLSSFMLMGIVMGYFIVALGRDIVDQNSFAYWSMIVSFMIASQGLGWIAKSYILPYLIQSFNEKKYLSIFYFVLFALGFVLQTAFDSLNTGLSIFLIFVFGMVFFTALSAIQSVSQNMLLSEVERKDYAMALSIQNMPGLLFIGLYSFCLVIYKNGCPEVGEIFVSVSAISLVFLLLHLITYKEAVNSEN